MKKYAALGLGVLVMLFYCATKRQALKESGFPDFITSNEDYYVTRIAEVPAIEASTCTLQVKGLVANPRSFSLEELYAMPMVELPLTVECIGNSTSGPLLSTPVWKGFRLYDLLHTLGIKEDASGSPNRSASGSCWPGSRQSSGAQLPSLNRSADRAEISSVAEGCRSI